MITSLITGGRKVVARVTITNAGGANVFSSGLSEFFTAPPIVKGISSIGAKMDVRTRKVSWSRVSVEFIDTGSIRTLIESEFVFNQELKIELFGNNGTPTTIFRGRIVDWQPVEGLVRVDCQDLRGQVRDLRLRARSFVNSDNDYILNYHPLQLIKRILDLVYPNALIDAASFDPDNYDTGSRANSHWNTARAVHGNFDRRLRETESALRLVDELALLLGGGVIIAPDGTIKFKIFDPSAAVDFALTDNQVERFEQVSSMNHQTARSRFWFGWKGQADGDIIVQIPSGKQRANPGTDQWLHNVYREDADALSDYAYPGLTDYTSENPDLESKWVGVNSMLEVAIADTDMAFTLIGGWISSFCGVQRFQNGVADGTINYTLNSGDRTALISFEWTEYDPIGSFGEKIVYKNEVIEVEAASIDTTVQGAPSTEGDDDLVAIPMRVTFTVKNRGVFGTTAQDIPRNALATDVTIPAAKTLQQIKRHSNGLPESEIDIGLEYADTELGALTSLVNDVFLAKGEDGLTGVEKLEVVGVELRQVIGADPGVTLTVVPAEDPTLPNVDDAWDRVRTWATNGIDDMFGDPFDEEDAPILDKSVLAGLNVFDPGGLFLNVGSGKVKGSGSWLVQNPANIPLIANRDNYLVFDSHNKAFIRIDTAIGAGLPTIHHAQQLIAVVETDGSSQVSRKDLREFQGLIVRPQIMAGANFRFPNSAFTSRYRREDRYTPDFIELTDGSRFGSGADVEIIKGSSATGDAIIQLNNPSVGVKTQLVPVGLGRPQRAEVRWTTVAGGTGKATVFWFKEDKITPTTSPSTTVFPAKAPAVPGTFQTERLDFNAPDDARWGQLVFESGPLSSNLVKLDRMELLPTAVSFRVYQNVAQAFSASITRVAFQVKSHDLGNNWFFALLPAASHFLVPADGRYKFNARITLDDGPPNSPDKIVALLVKNTGPTTTLQRFVAYVDPKKEPSVHLETPVQFLNRADKIELHFGQNVGGSRNTIIAQSETWFSGVEEY